MSYVPKLVSRDGVSLVGVVSVVGGILRYKKPVNQSSRTSEVDCKYSCMVS